MQKIKFHQNVVSQVEKCASANVAVSTRGGKGVPLYYNRILNNAIFKDLMKMFFNRDLGESFNRKLYKSFFYLHQADTFHLHRSEQKINESSKDEVRFPLVSWGTRRKVKKC